MDEGHRTGGLRQVLVGLALLAGLLIAIAACGDEGEPGLGTSTPAPPGTGGESSATPAVATTTPSAVTTGTPPAVTTASPVATAVEPTAAPSVTPTIVVGFDMDPSGNSATALGSPDRCISVSAESEDEFQVDVFLDGLSRDSVLGFGYDVNFPDGVVELVEADHSMLVEAATGSETVDLSADLPATISPYMVTVADFGPAEYNPPYTQGVLGRYTFKVLPTAEAGTYNLTLTEAIIGRDTKEDPQYPDYPLTGAVPIVAIWDGAFEPPYGIIAVDVSCDTAAARAS